VAIANEMVEKRKSEAKMWFNEIKNEIKKYANELKVEPKADIVVSIHPVYSEIIKYAENKTST
jgi:DNA-directed RNA polymerase delta subunit